METRDLVQLFLHYPAYLVVAYLLARSCGAWISATFASEIVPLIRAHVGLVNSLRDSFAGLVGRLEGIEAHQAAQAANCSKGFDYLKGNKE